MFVERILSPLQTITRNGRARALQYGTRVIVQTASEWYVWDKESGVLWPYEAYQFAWIMATPYLRELPAGYRFYRRSELVSWYGAAERKDWPLELECDELAPPCAVRRIVMPMGRYVADEQGIEVYCDVEGYGSLRSLVEAPTLALLALLQAARAGAQLSDANGRNAFYPQALILAMGRAWIVCEERNPGHVIPNRRRLEISLSVLQGDTNIDIQRAPHMLSDLINGNGWYIRISAINGEYLKTGAQEVVG